MPIILTNDDGLQSPTLHPLWRVLSSLGEVVIVVPSYEMSASSHSVTLHKPLVVRELALENGLKVFAVEGTPADCVLLSTRGIFSKVDLVVSGINIGPNLGWDIFYSGTVGAAREAAMYGVPAFSISLDCDGRGEHLDTAVQIASKIAGFLLQNPFPKNVFLNVNVPDLPREEIRGVEITRLGKRLYPSPVREIFRENSKRVFWVGGETPLDDLNEGTDTWAVAHKRVSITPLGLDLTSLATLKELKSLRWEDVIE
ncbi:5'/3'-nucleotidase SurE [bacterium]|nr:5'/3'-nucleotidase SurE [bacterium]